MVKQSVVAFGALLVLVAAASAAVQPQTEERVFNLIVGEKVDDEIAQELAAAPRYEPAIEPGKFDLSLTLGYYNAEKTLLKYDSIIYLATDEHFYYGDVELKNQTGFNPILRLGYTLTTWLALEAQSGISFSEYQGTIGNPRRVNPNIANPIPEILLEHGQYDPERRSALAWISNFNGILYPLNIGGSGKGRLHPYLTGGIGYVRLDIDSNYTDDASSSINVNGGFGLKFIADQTISLRAEVLYQHHEIGFEPAEFFDIRDQETVKVPVYAFDPEGGNFERVTGYRKNTLGGLTLQLGFTAKF